MEYYLSQNTRFNNSFQRPKYKKKTIKAHYHMKSLTISKLLHDSAIAMTTQSSKKMKELKNKSRVIANSMRSKNIEFYGGKNLFWLEET